MQLTKRLRASIQPAEAPMETGVFMRQRQDEHMAITSRARPARRHPASAYNDVVASCRGRLRVIFKIFVAVYIAALATLPLAHHDLVCHLKSSNHCGVCHVGTSADDASQRVVLAHKDLADAGRAWDAPRSFGDGCALLQSSGRSPPRGTLFFL
jgi:hypothetical protein